MIDYKPVSVVDGGGYIKPLSMNPYDNGIFLAAGKSHADGGIAIDSTGNGKANAEIEGGETLHVDYQGNTIVGGNLKVPGTNKTFKKAFKNIAQEEIKAEKLSTKGKNAAENSNPENKYGVLGHNAGSVMQWSADRQQKTLAAEKENLSQVQQAIHTVAGAMGKEPKEINKEFKEGGMLNKKKVTVVGVPDFKNGGILPEMKAGGKTTMAERNNNPGNMRDNKGNFIRFKTYEEGLTALQNKLNNAATGKSKVYSASGNLYDFYNHYAPKSDNNDPKKYAETVARKLGVSPLTPINQLGSKVPVWAQATAEQEDIAYSRKKNTTPLQSLTPINNSLPSKAVQTIQTQVPRLPEERPTDYIPYAGSYSVEQSKLVPDVSMIDNSKSYNELNNPIVPNNVPQEQAKRTPSLADSNKLGLTSFLPEIAALFDKPEPVMHQRLDPQLYQPYNVSFQDRLNQNNSSFKSVENQLVNNPEALSVLAAQKYQADNQVKAQEFAQNQGISSDVINKNVQLINQTKDRNLQLADTQFVRQEGAKENTKANIRGALNSISSKFAQNKLENNNIRLTEQMTNYRFNPNTGKMEYVGGPANLNVNGNPVGQTALTDPNNTVTLEPDPNGGFRVKKIVDNPNRTTRRFFGGKL